MHNTTQVIYVAWQAPNSRSWHTVGRLTNKNNTYLFEYTNGALESKEFIPFAGMTDLYSTYSSNELFPLFSNRLLPSRRPEYKSFLSWMDVEYGRETPMTIFAKSGGFRSTDNIQLFPEIIPDNEGNFELDFFAHGIKYLSESSQARIKNLNVGEKLFLMQDTQNEYDSFALAIRVEDPVEIVGYCPRFLAKDLSMLLSYNRNKVNITVTKNNRDAPTNYQLMCKVRGECKENRQLFMDREFQSIATQNARLG